jgi:hypothetical protein
MSGAQAASARSVTVTALVAGLAALFVARLGLSVTVASAPPTDPAAAPAAPAAAPVPAPRAGLPAPDAAQPDSSGTRYRTEGRTLVREISGTVPAGPARILLDTHLGSVRLRQASGAAIGYRVTIRANGADAAETRRLVDRMVVSASRLGDLLQFTGALPDPAGPRRGLAAEFDLAVPASVRAVDVSTGAGDIDAAGLPATLGLLTQGGVITAGDLGGPLRAETRGGRIDVGAVRAAARLVTSGGDVTVGTVDGDLLVRTAGGDVRITSAGREVRVESGGGSVHVERSGGAVRVATGGGDIDVGDSRGEVVAATAGGGIRVGRAAGGVRCETSAGPIVLDGVGGPVRAVSSAGSIRAILGGDTLAGDSDMQTWQGDVVVSLPEHLPVTVRALVDNPVGQPIHSDFPVTILHDLGEAGRPLEIGEITVGGGGPVLKLRTLNGRIMVMKAKDGPESKPAAAVEQ